MGLLTAPLKALWAFLKALFVGLYDIIITAAHNPLLLMIMVLTVGLMAVNALLMHKGFNVLDKNGIKSKGAVRYILALLLMAGIMHWLYVRLTGQMAEFNKRKESMKSRT
jgi:hypothetical protein